MSENATSQRVTTHNETGEESHLVSESIPEPPPLLRLPLRLSPDRRRILDADGNAVLLQGDAAWSLIANTTLDEARFYIEDRRRKGFNTLIVSLIEYCFAQDPPRNLAGDEPFTTPGDFRTPNEAYMAHAERVLEIAARARHARHPRSGVPRSTQFVAPGLRGTSRGVVSRKCSPTARRAAGPGASIWAVASASFGTSSGASAATGNPGETAVALDQMARGIRAAGVDNLFTAHVLPECSPLDVFPEHDWLDLNPTYTYEVVHRKLQTDWKRDPAWPFFLIESTYEGEHNASELQIRRQAYWSVLCGGNGHCMGNKPIWLFGDGWEAALDLPGSVAMARWGAFFRGLPWAELVPDFEPRDRHLRSGRGAGARPRDRGGHPRQAPRCRLPAGATRADGAGRCAGGAATCASIGSSRRRDNALPVERSWPKAASR